MSVLNPAMPEVFTVREIAKAAGVPLSEARALVARTDAVTVDGTGYVSETDAVRLIQMLHALTDGRPQPVRLFAPHLPDERRGRGPFAASGALHAGVLTILVAVASIGVRTAPTIRTEQDTARLVFVVSPGPGGGGGGGGLRDRQPAPKAEIRGASKLRSPVTVTPRSTRPERKERVDTTPPAVVPRSDAVPPPPQSAPVPTPPVVAPVVSAPADAADRPGVIAEAAPTTSHGTGSGGGTGTGQGTGMGEGAGAGIGQGSTAGTGGGPYRPGSGVTPPTLVNEVKPVYTEEGRRRSVEGDVVMEVVVRSDGSVGSVRVLQGLGAGLDQRAAEAVRQWRFTPARRFGTPVDVVVEVAVEFKLR